MKIFGKANSLYKKIFLLKLNKTFDWIDIKYNKINHCYGLYLIL